MSSLPRLAALLLTLTLAGCGAAPGPPPHRGPMVLVTFDALRADMVGALGGAPGLTPHLDRLMAESDWAGRGISPAGSAAPALASLLTGLRPWQHQALHPDQAVLAPELLTLPEALAAAGVPAAAYTGGYWAAERFGYAQGFSPLAPLRQGRPAVDALAGLGAGPCFVWIHLPEPETPYLRHESVHERVARLGGLPRSLPPRLERAQLEPFFDPARRLPPAKLRRFRAMYRLNVAWADERLGRLLAALRKSGQWDRTLLVVTANHGTELGEYGQILQGGSLGRRLIEVPLAVKLPRGFARRIAPPPGERVATTRLWATLVEAAGVTAPPAAAPSLFRPGIPAGVLSELYLGNGTNQFSWVDGDDQLLWEARFAPAEPEYYRARLQLVAAPPRQPLSEPPGRVMGRLAAAFAAAPPLTGAPGLYGGAHPRLVLERWDGSPRGSTPVEDPARTAALARRLERAWRAFVPAEWPPGRELAERPVPPPPPAPKRRDRDAAGQRAAGP